MKEGGYHREREAREREREREREAEERCEGERCETRGCEPFEREVDRQAAVKRIWHISDSQDQILALAFSEKSSKHFKLFPLRLEADRQGLGFQ